MLTIDRSIAIPAKDIPPLQINHHRREPSAAAAMSFVIPGLGQIYRRRLIDGFVLFFVWCCLSSAPITVPFLLTLLTVAGIVDAQAAANLVLLVWFISTPGAFIVWIYAVRDALRQ